MNILVIGCGSIGERHIKNLRSTYPEFQILATDISRERLSLMEKNYHVKACGNVGEAFRSRIDAVFVCTPPALHVHMALKAVGNNAHVFIEKPLSNSLEGTGRLLQKANARGLVIFVGYVFRFHPGLKLVKRTLGSGELGKILLAQAEYGQYLPDWRPWQDYRQSYTAKKDFGGGIILDSSHEIDYLRWLVGDVDQVFGFAGKLSDLQVETEDAAGILLRFSQGSIGMIRVDFVRKDYSRSFELICQNGTIKWNYQEDIVKIYRQDTKAWEEQRNLMPDKNEMYISEMKQFVACALGEEKPLIDGGDGLQTLKVALAIKKSVDNGTVVRL